MEFLAITNKPARAILAEESGIDRIMVDLEVLGKRERQGHLDTVISGHSVEDVAKIRGVLNRSTLVVRINPLHDASNEEIENVLAAGADVVMLPMFTTVTEVATFLSILDGRATSSLLLETPQALVRIEQILGLSGIDEVHVGLNDLHLSMGLDFMFELLAGGVVEHISRRVGASGALFGFGGVARLGDGLLDASLILAEHVRLGSEVVILSRGFFDLTHDSPVDVASELGKLRRYCDKCATWSSSRLDDNRTKVQARVRLIVDDR